MTLWGHEVPTCEEAKPADQPPVVALFVFVVSLFTVFDGRTPPRNRETH